MVFWVSILAGGLFIWLAIKIGFYETLAMLFNVVISIYLAIFLTPVIVDIIPAARETPYCNALALAVTSVGAFLILYGITYIFLTGQFKVTFPKIFDILFTGVLGFLTGFLILSFTALAITVTPISQNRLVNRVGFNKQSQQANISYICWWCDLVNTIVSSPDTKIKSEQVIDQLLNSTQPKRQDKTDEATGLTAPVEPNHPKTSINEEHQPEPP